MNAFILFSNEKRSELANLNPQLCAASCRNMLISLHEEPPPQKKSILSIFIIVWMSNFHPLPIRSNSAVSVLLGERWRDMPYAEKSSYVIAARKIKEEFAAAHPDAPRSRGVRKVKRKAADGLVLGRSITPPSLHTLALIGSRLNQQPLNTDELDGSEQSFQSSFQSHAPESISHSVAPSLLDQLCTVAENEHTAAAQMLSTLSAC